MAAQSLYRKWRSQTFDELVGQEHVIQTLRNAVVEDRIGHAYLFTGPRGVGKTSMARLLAKAVNCEAEPVRRPCGECSMCIAISEGRAVDVIEMDAASHTSVDDARDLIDRVQFRPAQGRYKVYVIDEVHMLSTAAFNALLKTLEEPPAHAIFILATTELHKVPATIVSRCQRFVFARHTIADIARHLLRVAEAEQIELDVAAAHAIARSATGSMRDALGVLEQLASFTSGVVKLEHVTSLLGMTSAGEVDALIAALLAADVAGALRAVNSVADQGADIRQFTRDLVERLRMLLLRVATGTSALDDVHPDEREVLEGWSAQAHAGALVHWIKLLSNLDFQLRTSPYGHLPLELAVVEALVAPPPAATPAASAAPARSSNAPASPSRRASFSKPAQPAPVAAPPPAASPPAPEPLQPAVPPADAQATAPPVPAAPAPAAEPPVPTVTSPPALPAEREVVHAVAAELGLFDQVEAVWAEVIRDVRPYNKNLQAVLNSIHPVDVEANTLLLQAPSPFHKGQVENPKNRRIIEDVLTRHVGQPLTIRCIEQQPQAREADLREQMREARKDPRVRAAINIFSPVDVSIEAAAEPE